MKGFLPYDDIYVPSPHLAQPHLSPRPNSEHDPLTDISGAATEFRRLLASPCSSPEFGAACLPLSDGDIYPPWPLTVSAFGSLLTLFSFWIAIQNCTGPSPAVFLCDRDCDRLQLLRTMEDSMQAVRSGSEPGDGPVEAATKLMEDLSSLQVRCRNSRTHWHPRISCL